MISNYKIRLICVYRALKKKYETKINEYIHYFYKTYHILFSPDMMEAYDYFDIISLWKLFKHCLF